ncbi:MAG TPA: hypothetical protein VF469_16480 [Kofleriaceae bacterium]
MRCAVVALLVACSAGASAEHVRTGHEAMVETMVGRALGMNDVSILLPLPRDVATPVLAALAGRGALLVDRGWFDALVTAGGDIAPRTGDPLAFDDFQIVAVRFDLCDRSAIGPCPPDAQGRLRLVLQPLYTRAGSTFAHDVALHAFYPIPASEVGGVVGELRRLSRIQREPPGAPLAVSPAAAAGDAGYLAGLRTLVLRYARAENLVRLTVIGQVADSAAFAWIFRGVDRRSRIAGGGDPDGSAGGAGGLPRGIDRLGDPLVPMVIPGIAATQQTVQLAGGDTVYRTDPIADVPSGFALATNGPRLRPQLPRNARPRSPRWSRSRTRRCTTRSTPSASAVTSRRT